jgi:hypothetical protein
VIGVPFFGHGFMSGENSSQRWWTLGWMNYSFPWDIVPIRPHTPNGLAVIPTVQPMLRSLCSSAARPLAFGGQIQQNVIDASPELY